MIQKKQKQKQIREEEEKEEKNTSNIEQFDLVDSWARSYTLFHTPPHPYTEHSSCATVKTKTKQIIKRKINNLLNSKRNAKNICATINWIEIVR